MNIPKMIAALAVGMLVGVFMVLTPVPLYAEDSSDLTAAEQRIKSYEYEKALIILEKMAAAGRGGAQVEKLLGDACLGLDMINEAIEHYKEAARLEPENFAVYMALGEVAFSRYFWGEAAEFFMKAVDIEPNSVLALNYLGCTLTATGDIENAVKYLQKAIRLDPSYPDSYLNLGTVMIQVGEYKDAVEVISESARLDPTSYIAFSNLSYAYYKIGESELALDAIEHAVRLNPDDPQILKNLSFLATEIAAQRDGIAPERVPDYLAVNPDGPVTPADLTLTLNSSTQDSVITNETEVELPAETEVEVEEPVIAEPVAPEEETVIAAVQEVEVEPVEIEEAPDPVIDIEAIPVEEPVAEPVVEMEPVPEIEIVVPEPAPEPIPEEVVIEIEQPEVNMETPAPEPAAAVASSLENMPSGENIDVLTGRPFEDHVYVEPKKEYHKVSPAVEPAVDAPRNETAVDEYRAEPVVYKEAVPEKLPIVKVSPESLDEVVNLAPMQDGLQPLPVPSADLSSEIELMDYKYMPARDFLPSELNALKKNMPGIIYFSDVNRMLWRYKPATNSVQKMFHGSNPGCSPSGTMIGFIDWDMYSVNLYIYDFKTSVKSLVYSTNDVIKEIKFSPDGKYISLDHVDENFKTTVKVVSLETLDVYSLDGVSYESYTWEEEGRYINLLEKDCDIISDACWINWDYISGRIDRRMFPVKIDESGSAFSLGFFHKPQITSMAGNKLLIAERLSGSTEYHIGEIGGEVTKISPARPDGSSITISNVTTGLVDGSVVFTNRGNVWVDIPSQNRTFPILTGYFIDMTPCWCKSPE